MVVLTFMRLCNNHRGIHYQHPLPEPGWLIGRGEINFNIDLIMLEVHGISRCNCDRCISWDAKAISDGELAFAGFRQYVESCAPADLTPDNAYTTALFYLNPYIQGAPTQKGR